jgi:hypothetical protein
MAFRSGMLLTLMMAEYEVCSLREVPYITYNNILIFERIIPFRTSVSNGKFRVYKGIHTVVL